METTFLESIVSQSISDLEFNDCYIVEIQISNNKFEVFLDSDEGVTFAKCQRISRRVEEKLDADANIPDKYTLDVSSAGVGRPLKLLRQYIKNIGRDLEVKTIDGKILEGELLTADENELSLEVLKDPNSKKKVKETEKIIVAMNQISQSKIKVRF